MKDYLLDEPVSLYTGAEKADILAHFLRISQLIGNDMRSGEANSYFKIASESNEEKQYV